MTDLSSASALSAAVRAVRGETDLTAVCALLDNPDVASVVALSSAADPVFRVVAALACGLLALLDESTLADPALHDAVERVVWTGSGWHALRSWAAIAPAGWGRAHAAALRDAVRQGMCDSCVAAALIGPDDRSASLLRSSADIAFAIRRWGQSDPGAPTAWATALAPAERDRLITTALSSPFACASCLPWLPPDVAWSASENRYDDIALDAFAAASPTVRTQGEAILQVLVARTQPGGLESLTRLACAVREGDIWRRVQTLVRESPDDAWRVVAAAPWDDLPEDVRAAILDLADTSSVCAAVAAARGRWDASMTGITWEPAVAFFAALDPRVWDALDRAPQQRWRRALWDGHAPLAVRSIGVRTEILARAKIGNTLVRAAQRHGLDAHALRWALLPVALRSLPPAAAHALIAAMPTQPPDPGAFFCIAGGRDDPDLIAPARSALRTPADLACAVALQRCGDIFVSFHDHTTAIRHALRGRSWDDLTPIMPLLDARVRAELTPDADALVAHLAHPDRREALRLALDRLAALPPEVAIPTRVALGRPWNSRDAAAALTHALHAHGGVFLEIADALTDALRARLLPLPKDSALADALRALAQDDPVTARRLTHALRSKNRRTALLALLEATPHHASAVWQALDNAARRGVVSVLAAAPSDADPLAVFDPIAALALAASQSEHDDLRNVGSAAFAARCARIRAIWDDLPPEIQQMLGDLPAFADLPIALARPAIRRGRRW